MLRLKQEICMFKKFMCVMVAAAAGSLFLVLPAVAQSADARPGSITVGGVTFEPDMTFQGKKRLLNGAGIRNKVVFKVYAAGLYLPKKVSTPKEVFESPGPKHFKAVFLREIDSGAFGKNVSQVMNDNLPRERIARCVPGIIKLGEVFAAKKKIGPGEYFTVDEVPGTGSVISINGQVATTISEAEFFTCLMYNYFGEVPADHLLKAALLGQGRP